MTPCDDIFVTLSEQESLTFSFQEQTNVPIDISISESENISSNLTLPPEENIFVNLVEYESLNFTFETSSTTPINITIAPEEQVILEVLNYGIDGASGLSGYSGFGISGWSGYSGAAGEGTLTEEIISMLDVGGISGQEVIPQGTTFTDFVKDLLLTTFYPTFINPAFSLSSVPSAPVECGTLLTFTLTYNFSRGSILGKLVGGIWQPTTFQDYRVGAATGYVIDGTNTGLVNTKTKTDYPITEGNNTFSGTITHAIGAQPTDSDGANYDSPYAAGSVVRTVTISGQRKYFYGCSNAGVTSADIRSLSNSGLNPANGTTFDINIPIGATNVVFAYPATLEDVASVKYVEASYVEVKNNFTQTLVNVEGANGYTVASYKVYIYAPPSGEPFTMDETYRVTI